MAHEKLITAEGVLKYPILLNLITMFAISSVPLPAYIIMKTRSLKKDKVNIITLGCSKNMVDSEVLSRAAQSQ